MVSTRQVQAKAHQAPQEGHGPVVDPPGLAILICYVAFEYLSHGVVGGFNSGMEAAAEAFLRQVQPLLCDVSFVSCVRFVLFRKGWSV